jgi:hypothetical protein
MSFTHARTSEAHKVVLPVFAGFPYILTNLSPAFHHIILLSRELGPAALRLMAQQVEQLPTCRVIDDSLGLYGSEGMDEFVTGHSPQGGGRVDQEGGGGVIA